MTQAVSIYLDGVKVATGTATSASATIASTTDVSNLYGRFQPGTGRLAGQDVIVHSTTGANAAGRSHRTRILTDSETSLVMAAPHPFLD